MTTLPFNLKSYIFTSKELKTADGALVQRHIKAKSMESAWGKFATQYFGTLKPAPSDWIVQEVEI